MAMTAFAADDSRMMISVVLETLVDWFETIEEIEVTEEIRWQLYQAAESLAASKQAAMEMGVDDADFDEWLRFDVLEHWSELMDDMDDMAPIAPVEAFYNFVIEGEQRLYLQMVKRLSPLAKA